MLQQSSCPNCGAPVGFERTKPQVQCAYCRSPLVPLQRGDAVTLEAFDKVKEALDQSSRATQAAILETERGTQQELRQLRLSQELAAAQTQINQVRAELRSLSRGRVGGVERRQIRDLSEEERKLLNQIKALQAQLGQQTPAESARPRTSNSCAGVFIMALVLLVFYMIMTGIGFFSEQCLPAVFLTSVVVSNALFNKLA